MISKSDIFAVIGIKKDGKRNGFPQHSIECTRIPSVHSEGVMGSAYMYSMGERM